jgi:hypothetical protein
MRADLPPPLGEVLAAPPPQTADPPQTLSQRLADAGFKRRPSIWALDAREARELIAAPPPQTADAQEPKA